MSVDQLSALRYGLDQVAQILNTTRSVVNERIRAGELRSHKDGRRVFVTADELRRYVTAKSGSHTAAAP